jgi:hypothetical protein
VILDSNSLVYNNIQVLFPSEKQIKTIEEKAQQILDQ